MEQDIVEVTGLPKIEALTDEDTLLLIRQEGDIQKCYQIKGKQFSGKDGKDGAKGADGVNGKSAYEVAQEQGFTGSYEEWATQLKEVTEYDTKGMLSFKGLAGSDANKSLASGIYPNISVNVPVAGESFLVQSLRTTTAVYNQYYSTQIAIGTSANVLGKVYIRKNSQKSGSYTFGDWVDLTAKIENGSVTYEALDDTALTGIKDYLGTEGVPSTTIENNEISNLF